MSLNIKNEDTHKLAAELAALTGESMTVAITVALRERLNRVRPENQSSLAERLLAIGKDCSTRMKEPFKFIDHGQLLYDENGLPK